MIVDKLSMSKINYHYGSNTNNTNDIYKSILVFNALVMIL